MSVLRLYSLYDAAVGAYMRPFWSDHKANALRSVTQLVNDKSDSNNMVANHPDQFVLFEIGVFDPSTGEFCSNVPALSLGNCVEFIKTPDFSYRPELNKASGT